MKKLWHKFVFQIKRVPWYGWVAAVVMLGIQTAFYAGGKAIVDAWSHQWWIIPKINGLDDAIPFCAYFWIEVYLFSFIFWFFAPIVTSVTKKEKFLNHIITMFAIQFISFLIFIFAPTYMNRVDEGLVTKNGGLGTLITSMNPGLSRLCMKNTFFFDGGKINPNLLPSLHCSISLLAYLAIARNNKISLGFRIYTFVLSILIGMATLFTKQHYFVDVIGGYLLAVAVWYAMKLIKPGERLVKKYPNILVIRKKPNRNLQKKK